MIFNINYREIHPSRLVGDVWKETTNLKKCLTNDCCVDDQVARGLSIPGRALFLKFLLQILEL